MLGLFAERPLLCVVDDAHWLDRMSMTILTFVARRLDAEPVGMVFAVRTPEAANLLDGLPELPVEGLGDADARALLDEALPGPVDDRVRDRIVAETRGNPLALIELPRGLTPAELAFGFGARGGGQPVAGRVEEGFQRRIAALPTTARLLHGEWLRRENRRAEARVGLRAAHEAFTAMGAEGFAARAGRELGATGETVRSRAPAAVAALTPQESQIAKLAVAGRTNPDIAAAMFLSPRTVERHLRKVFTKLGITSRRELASALRPS
ncbi:helix-turn-helix transcriptional regulator [Actinoplanes solisilvae]|uniref:helix-turn-helix transcriptional regulator n=1 Tax=Actinoplanes solisilvae TaxID=2486853 RepID=UPI001F0CAFD8|nr:LuxR family transcriptional regulator [Actinoplanes solisilvae]